MTASDAETCAAETSPFETSAGVRRILHVDMDAFFASVEQRDNPELRGKPVIVGGRPDGRGVVAAASYEARTFGVRSAMPSGKAARLCPHAIFVRSRFEAYKEASRAVFTIFRSITPHVEGLSLDEGFLDVTDHLEGFGTGRAVAKHIRMRIREEVGLTASAGVAPLKFVAKIASAHRKPDGLTVVAPTRVRAFLEPLPIEKLWGVGPKTAARLHAHDLHTIGDVARQDPRAMMATFGRQGDHIWRMSQGIDPRRVRAHRDRKSRSAERTFANDIADICLLQDQLIQLADRISAELQRSEEAGRTIVLKVRYADFSTVTRSTTLHEPTSDAAVLATVANQMLHNRTAAGKRPVRLLGLGVRVEGKRSGVGRQLHLPFR